MRRTLVRAVSFALVAGAAALYAQQPSAPMPAPRINTVFPMGGQLGTTVEVTVSGSDLDEPTSLIFTAPEIKGELIVPPEPVADPKAKDKPAPKPKRRAR